MSEIGLSDLRKSLLIQGSSAVPARALHVLMESLAKGALGDKAYEPITVSTLEKALGLYDAQIKQRFNLRADDVLSAFGMNAPVTQVFAHPDKANMLFYAYSARPHIFATTNAERYMLDVPVGYDGVYFIPKLPKSRLVEAQDFIQGGMGNYSIKGVGGVVQPAVLTMDIEPCPLPQDFDPLKHDWLKIANRPEHPYTKKLVIG